MLADAILKTKKVLTTRQIPPQSTTPYKGRTVTIDDIQQQVKRTCVEIVRVTKARGKFTESVLHKPYAPSVHASYTSTRSRLGTFGDLIAGGYLGEIKYDDEILPLDDPVPKGRRTINTDFGRQVLDPFRGVEEYVGAVEIVSGEEEVRCSSGEELRVLESLDEELVVRPEWGDSFKSYYASIYERVRESEKDQKFDVKLVALAESLKIRVISKGPGFKYFLLKPLQKFLSKMLGKMRCFRLTRETVSEAYLDEMFSKVDGLFHSLDYEGATDNANPLCSKAACESLSELLELAEDIAQAFLLSLVGHTIDGAEQVWGQLMGSVTSFVILCILNAAIIRFSFELSEKRSVSLEECPMSVNGDDGLVRASAAFLPIWEDVAAVAGLKPSIGKVYTHPSYANINSTSYEFLDGHFHLIPYVNMGLLYGFQRSSVGLSPTMAADSWDERSGSLGARVRALNDFCPPRLREHVHRAFIARHSSLLTGILSGTEWYVPEEFGGLGFPTIYRHPSDVPDWSGDVDDLPLVFGMRPWQVAAVSWLANHPNANFTRRIPKEAPVRARAAWSSSIPYRSSRTRSFRVGEKSERLLDVSAYYVAPTLVRAELSADPLRQLKANIRAWGRLRRRFDRDPATVHHCGTPSDFVSNLFSPLNCSCAIGVLTREHTVQQGREVMSDVFDRF